MTQDAIRAYLAAIGYSNCYEVYFPAVMPHWERSELIERWLREHSFKSVQWDPKRHCLSVWL